MKFYYTYILFSLKDKKHYIGYTDDLINRYKEHNSGKCKSTKDRRPLILIHYEAFNNKEDALAREKYFKTGDGRHEIKKILKNSYKNIAGVV